MLIRTSTRRLTAALTIAACLVALAMALLGPSQTLAQTRKAACPSSAVHAKARRGARACVRSSRRGRAHHRRKRHVKHALAKAPQQTVPTALPAAYCEDGSAPARASDGSFSCADGSEPECEDGAEPTRSSGGKRLVCAIPEEAQGEVEGEVESEAESGESECEEGVGPSCSATTLLGSSEQICEASSSDSSSFVCEQES